MSFKELFCIKRLLKAFHYAACGLKTGLQFDIAFKQEIFLSIIIIPLAFVLGVTSVEKVLLLSSWFLVLIVELLNSSIEAIVDRISLDIHPLSKKIKDMSSGAVLLSILNVIVVWAIIVIGRYF